MNRPLRILAIGWYGADNVGDELLLLTLNQWVREFGGELTAISVNPKRTIATAGIAAVGFSDLPAIARVLMETDLFIMGGGGIFQDYSDFHVSALYAPGMNDIANYAKPFYMARQFGVPTLVWAHGVGPLRGPEGRQVVHDVFTVADFVSVRDEGSASLLREIGVERPFTLAPDPLWGSVQPTAMLDNPAFLSEENGRKRLALIIREWRYQEGWEPMLAEALRGASDPEWEFVWLPFQAGEADGTIASDLSVTHELRNSLPEETRGTVVRLPSASDAYAVIARCEAVLSMRLHGNILALRAGRPLVSLEYDPKMGAAAEDAGVPRAQRIALGEPSDRISSALARVMGRADPPWVPKRDLIDRLAQRSRAHRDILSQAMRSSADAPATRRWQSGRFDWLSTWGTLDHLHARVTRTLAEQDAQLASARKALDDDRARFAQTLAEQQSQIRSARESLEHDRARLAQALAEKEGEIASMQAALAHDRTHLCQMLADKEDLVAQHEAYIADKEIYIAQLLEMLAQARRWNFTYRVIERTRGVRRKARLFWHVSRSEGPRSAVRKAAKVVLSSLRPKAIMPFAPTSLPNPYDLINPLKPIEVQVVDVDYAGKPKSPPFSCVTTVRNEAAGIEYFLESIARQEAFPEEIIVVDGGSTDATVRLIRSFEEKLPCRLTLIEAGEVNIAKGRNIGIEAAAHDIVLLIDAGCRLSPGFFANMTGPFVDQPDLDLVGGIYQPLEASPSAFRFIHNWTTMESWNSFLPSARALCLRKSIWRAAGGFPEYLTRTGEDTLFDLNYRRHSTRWLFNKQASVLWDAPRSKEAADRLSYLYGVGDGESGVGDFAHYARLVDILQGRSRGAVDPMLQGFLEGRRQRAAIEVERRRIKGLLLMLSGVPFTDSGGGQRCTQLSMAFARRSYKVIFANIYPSFEERKKLHFEADLSLFEFYNLSDLSLTDLVDRYGPFASLPIVALLEFPHPSLLPVVNELRRQLGERVTIIYDYLDNWRSSLGWEWYSEDSENAVIEAADCLIASGKTLQRDLEKRSGRAVALVPNAVNDHLFDPARPYVRPSDFPASPRVVTYIGALWGEWYDWELLAKAVAALDDTEFVLIGGVDARRAADFAATRPNVRFLGLKAQTALPAYLAHTSVCIIPFKVDQITHYVNPLKVYEYLAMRRAVVATAMAELVGLPGVTVASSPDQFVAEVRHALSSPPGDTSAVDAFVRRNNWAARVAAIERVARCSIRLAPFPIVDKAPVQAGSKRLRDDLRNWAGVVDIMDGSPSCLPRALRNQIESSNVHEDDYFIVRCFDRPGDLCLDVGANVGQSAVSMRIVNPDLRIVSFEPNPLLADGLERLKGVYRDYEVVMRGLGSAEGSLDLLVPMIGDRLLMSPLASTDPAVFALNRQGSYLVELAAGAGVKLLRQRIDVLPGDSLGLKPTFIKIDVEGTALEVLQGLAHTVASHKPLLMIENAGDPGAMSQLLIHLDQVGYGAYQYDRGRHELVQIVLAPGNGDIDVRALPLNIFYLHRDRIDDMRRRGVAVAVPADRTDANLIQKRWRERLLALVLTGVALLAGSGARAADTTALPLMFGAYARSSLQASGGELTAMNAWLTANGGSGVALAGDFMSLTFNPVWNVPTELNAAWNAGLVPFVNLSLGESWEAAYGYYDANCATAAPIAAGLCESKITLWADAFKAWAIGGRKALISPMPEMNSDWVSYGTGTNANGPAAFVNAYKRIQAVFVQRGVSRSSVRWVFAPNGWSEPSKPWQAFENYYPGDDATDVVAFSAYNYGGCPADSPWRIWDAFLVRAKEGEPTNGCTTAPFPDAPLHRPQCKYIKRLVELGITSGCGAGNYCRSNVVGRDRMATFLARAFNW